ncbi:MAG TPA: hypothetical protein VHV75_08030 [Solirubrobacteraceae bacterium]|jgi:aryl-alcohol dehydrogenase-like predicted oxidoreductase|nr:hypothetical protein [Solirubrobacteraceae bacterium]
MRRAGGRVGAAVVDLVLSGATTVEMLRSNLTELDLKLAPVALDQLQGLALEPEVY